MTESREEVPSSFFELFAQFLHAFQEGQVSPEDFLNDFIALQNQVKELQEKIQELHSREPQLNEELANLEQAVSVFTQGANTVSNALQSQDKALLAQGMSQLETAFHALRQGLIRLSEQKSVTGPSKDKPLNLLLNAKASWEAGSLPDEAFEAVLSSYHDYFNRISRNYRRIFKASSSLPDFSNAVEALFPVYQKAREAFRAFQELCSKKAFDQMFEPLEVIQQFSDEYYDLCQELQRYLDENKVAEEEKKPDEKKCLRCGKSNSMTAWSCSSCGFVFPQLEPSGQARLDVSEGSLAQGFVMTENIEKLFNAVEDFQDDEMTREDFLVILNWLDEKVEMALQECNARRKVLQNDGSVKPDMKAVLMQIDSEFLEGLDEMKNGLVLLQAWSGSRDYDGLLAGTGQVQDGAAKVYHAQGLAKKMLEDIQPEPEPSSGDRFSGTA